YMDYENGTGFEIVVPSLSGVIYNNEEDYEEYSNGSPVSGTSSSSGGCEAGFTVLGLMLPMLLFRKKSQ
ncbi:MAG: SYNERG-CTERM sorting domain-containing protein, partial [Synergistaceae bacterium]|nr:SYNERG-CTERM sorting domain-containing protein [Synergistaceae bacterium]